MYLDKRKNKEKSKSNQKLFIEKNDIKYYIDCLKLPIERILNVHS